MLYSNCGEEYPSLLDNVAAVICSCERIIRKMSAPESLSIV